MLFDFPHILFMVISFSIVAVLEIVFFKYVHNQKTKDTILKLSALLTLIIHHSSLWYDFIVNKQAIIEENMLFMIYPCNVAMWFLFIYAFIDYKDNIVMKMLAEYTFYLGIFGGIIGIMFNQNYGSNPNLFDFHIFKGLLSHATMLFGAIYLRVGGYMNIRFKNVISAIIGYLFMLVNAFVIIKIYDKIGMEVDNPMFLMEAPIDKYPFINIYTMGLTGLILLSIITIAYEYFFLKKEDRWYSLIINKMNKKKEEKDNE